MKSEDIKKFGVLILESLKESDIKTGKKLSEEILRYKQFEQEVLSVEYFNIRTKVEFISILSLKIDEAIKMNHYYFLHFEIHGLEGAIQLQDGEIISWEEIFPLLRRLNTHYKNYLVLYLGVCKSASFIKFLNPLERAPFRVALTTTKNLKNIDLLNGFEAFYSKFFFSLDITLSLEEYNKTVTHRDSKLYQLTSEFCFDQICDLERSSADHKSTKTIIVNYLNKQNTLFKFLSEKEQEKFISLEKIKISDECKSNRDYFLMIDLNI